MNRDESFSIKAGGLELACRRVHSLVLGSGAAALNAADRLHEFGLRDLAIVTEGLDCGTSLNTGSDKQTYYRLSSAAATPDSPYEMAEALYRGGSMHGDLALAEAVGSSEAFFHLVSIGVPFPMNPYGGFVGYKTDHDPRQRGTSLGPYTSKVMVERLLSEVARRGIRLYDRHHVLALLRSAGRCIGAAALDESRLAEKDRGLTLFMADNVVFGTGGPGGLYESSVYPAVQVGGLGLGLEAGAGAVNLPESQYGLASVKFRWNVSGSYQQVLPRYVSTAPDGSDEREFLAPYFDSPGEQAGAVFLKGYQWPFDPRKLENRGSSLIDLLVHVERMEKGRRVFMDFRANPGRSDRFDFSGLPEEARGYLEKSGVLFGTPIQRLEKMNPLAIELYRANGIDLAAEPLEIGLCAQHNNGGLAGDAWWESPDLARLFPVGEVNGSHGVYRPGGAALNSGQVGSLRAARKIAGSYSARELGRSDFEPAAREEAGRLLELMNGLLAGSGRAAAACRPSAWDAAGVDAPVADYRRELQRRMSSAGAAIRETKSAAAAVSEALEQLGRFPTLSISHPTMLPYALANRQLALSQAAYLSAISAGLEAGGGSRGSALVLDPAGRPVHPRLDRRWRLKPEDESFRDKLLATRWNGKRFEHEFVPRRPIPNEEYWFENAWRDFRSGAYLARRW